MLTIPSGLLHLIDNPSKSLKISLSIINNSVNQSVLLHIMPSGLVGIVRLPITLKLLSKKFLL
jgi:hypothetical protein